VAGSTTQTNNVAKASGPATAQAYNFLPPAGSALLGQAGHQQGHRPASAATTTNANSPAAARSPQRLRVGARAKRHRQLSDGLRLWLGRVRGWLVGDGEGPPAHYDCGQVPGAPSPTTYAHLLKEVRQATVSLQRGGNLNGEEEVYYDYEKVLPHKRRTREEHLAAAAQAGATPEQLAEVKVVSGELGYACDPASMARARPHFSYRYKPPRKVAKVTAARNPGHLGPAFLVVLGRVCCVHVNLCVFVCGVICARVLETLWMVLTATCNFAFPLFLTTPFKPFECSASIRNKSLYIMSCLTTGNDVLLFPLYLLLVIC